jgi:uncharacterized protein YdhG (YjbR/CyaY superfamily)
MAGMKTKSTTPTKKRYDGFSEEEKAAMKNRVQESRRSHTGKADPEAEVLAKIAELPESDRILGERLHAIVKASAPTLSPRLWYGMPAYEMNGKVLCFFQAAQKFKTRYATFGFSDVAKLDEGAMWPNSYALMKLTPADEKRIAELLKKAVG